MGVAWKGSTSEGLRPLNIRRVAELLISGRACLTSADTYKESRSMGSLGVPCKQVENVGGGSRMTPPPLPWPSGGARRSTEYVPVPASVALAAWNRRTVRQANASTAKDLATLCVQNAQSRTRSCEIAFLRSLKIVQLIGNARTEPH